MLFRWINRSCFAAIIAALVPLATSANTHAAGGSSINKTSSNAALHGYDVVAYFVQGKAVKGKTEFTHLWMNATWHFSTAAHRDSFARNPEKYAPQYGGYCAFGVSRGYTVDVDPNAWKIVDGRLYLNNNKQVQQQWEQDIPGHIKKANAHWLRLIRP